MLKTTISQFVALQKKWANENDIKNFVICLYPQNFKSYDIIRLKIVGRKDEIYNKGFDRYIVMDGVPVFIKNNLSIFYENDTPNDTAFLNSILSLYKIELFDYDKYLEEKRKNYKPTKEDLNAAPWKDKNGNTISFKDAQPVWTAPSDLSSGKTQRYDWEITFFNGKNNYTFERILVNGL